MGETPDAAAQHLRADARRNRDRLLAAASEVFAAQGADASLEEIARRAGVGSATLHRHFRGRAELLAAVLRERVAALCARADDLATAPDPGAALATWLRDVVTHAATVRGLEPALVGYRHDPEFSPHTLIRAAARRLLDRARRAGAVDDGVAVDDVLQLAGGIALATASLADPGVRADALMALATRGVLRGAANTSHRVGVGVK